MVVSETDISTLWKSGGEITKPIAKEDNPFSGLRERPEGTEDPVVDEKFELLKDIPRDIIRKAWFTLSHLILDPNATVVDMGCQDGAMIYAMAVFRPGTRFIGVDKGKRQINKARRTYNLPNLEFRVGDITKDIFESGSVDAIVNSFILYEIYSQSRYNERTVRSALRNHVEMLKPGGLMFIRDYACPPAEEYVLIEMPDIPSRGEGIEDMSEADLLVWFSENVRPNVKDPGCCGFYLEELPPRLPKTRLFRVPYKWAYEFIIRKDIRENWNNDLQKEYTCFTDREFRKELRSMGARVVFSVEENDDLYIRQHFEGHFRMYRDDGSPLGWPPTSFIAVAHKVGEGKSLTLEENRPSREKNTGMKIFSMRNENDGRIVDIVGREYDFTNVIPYRFNEHGGINVFIHEGIPRSIINAVPRQGENLDGKRWSGHMIEPLSIDSGIIKQAIDGGSKEIIKFANSYFGLKPAIGTEFENGPSLYPAPEYIDELIETKYLRVESGTTKSNVNPNIAEDTEGFSSRGRIREVDAQSLINAISVGMLPSSRLEIQLLTLYHMTGKKADIWRESPLNIPMKKIDHQFSIRDVQGMMEADDSRYREVKGNSGQLRMINSIFVDEGYSGGSSVGMVSKGMDFIIPGDDTINTAVVLPLTANLNGEIMAGVITEYLPVPQRYKGNGMVLSVPSFHLPRDIKTVDEALLYVAEKLDVSPDTVYRMGESFFCHSGVTPQRIYPFAAADVSIDKWQEIGRGQGPVNFGPVKTLWKLIYYANCESYMYTMLYAYTTLCKQTEATHNISYQYKMEDAKIDPTRLYKENVYIPGGDYGYGRVPEAPDVKPEKAAPKPPELDMVWEGQAGSSIESQSLSSSKSPRKASRDFKQKEGEGDGEGQGDAEIEVIAPLEEQNKEVEPERYEELDEGFEEEYEYDNDEYDDDDYEDSNENTFKEKLKEPRLTNE